MTWVLCRFVWVVEIDLVSVCGPKITWYQCIIAFDFGFVWVGEIGLVSMWGIELNLIFVKGSELTSFCTGVAN